MKIVKTDKGTTFVASNEDIDEFGKLVIPREVTVFSQDSLGEIKNPLKIKEINFGRVEIIEEGACYGLGLEKIVLPISLKIIKEYAFINCKNVEYLSIYGGSFHGKCFVDCDNIKRVKILGAPVFDALYKHSYVPTDLFFKRLKNLDLSNAASYIESSYDILEIDLAMVYARDYMNKTIENTCSVTMPEKYRWNINFKIKETGHTYYRELLNKQATDQTLVQLAKYCPEIVKYLEPERMNVKLFKDISNAVVEGAIARREALKVLKIIKARNLEKKDVVKLDVAIHTVSLRIEDDIRLMGNELPGKMDELREGFEKQTDMQRWTTSMNRFTQSCNTKMKPEKQEEKTNEGPF